MQGFPNLHSSVLVESDDAGSGFAADEKDQQVAVDQRRGHARRPRYLVILSQILLPAHVAAARGEAEEVAEPPDRMKTAISDDRCRDRTALLRRVKGPVGVRHLIGMSPNRLAGCFVKAEKAFLCLGPNYLG